MEEGEKIGAGERVLEERQNWRRGEAKGREPSYERNGSWSRKVGGERRREALGEEGSRGENCVLGGKLQRKGFGDEERELGLREERELGGKLERKREEGSSLSRSASLPPASRERARVKRVSDSCIINSFPNI